MIRKQCKDNCYNGEESTRQERKFWCISCRTEISYQGKCQSCEQALQERKQALADAKAAAANARNDIAGVHHYPNGEGASRH
jgi:predicted ATP-dependent serine protease